MSEDQKPGNEEFLKNLTQGEVRRILQTPPPAPRPRREQTEDEIIEDLYHERRPRLP